MDVRSHYTISSVRLVASLPRIVPVTAFLFKDKTHLVTPIYRFFGPSINAAQSGIKKKTTTVFQIRSDVLRLDIDRCIDYNEPRAFEKVNDLNYDFTLIKLFARFF